MVEAICTYTNDKEVRLELLSSFNLPKNEKVLELIKPFLEDQNIQKHVSVIDYIKNLTTGIVALNTAIEYHKNPYVANSIKAALLLNISPKEITGFTIPNDVLYQFKHYFFDMEKTDLVSWQTYLDLLPTYDKELLINAQAQNKDLVLVNLGKLPSDMHLIVNDLVITAFKKFKESVEENPRIARIWARIATDAMINQGNSGVDLSSKPFELILQEFAISTEAEEKPKVIGQNTMVPEDTVPIEEPDPDEIHVQMPEKTENKVD
jgi:hypothetical protein